MIGLLLLASASQVHLERMVRQAPPLVRAFIERRGGCNHWAGEEPYDKDRARQIEAMLRNLSCTRIEADERALRHRYARRSDLLALIDATSGWD